MVGSLKERVDNLKKLMPLIGDLRNPAMRERHWKTLMEEVGLTLTLILTLTLTLTP